ncbi:MAG: hypothetical protein EOO55_04435 [Hymenobacter sp.]|nr:MAG: hypothetical protein EOO55_04435 [Hymenobacter sp.]
MPAPQQLADCLAQIFRIATALLPDKAWNTLYLECSIVEAITEVKSWYTVAGSAERIEYDTFDLDYINEDADNNDMGLFIAQLRDLTADAVKGAWYTAIIEFHRNSPKPTIQYNYHDKPFFSQSLPLALYKKDLKVYPRASQHVPEWLA